MGAFLAVKESQIKSWLAQGFYLSACLVFLGLYFSISLMWVGLGVFLLCGIALAIALRDFSWVYRSPLFTPVLVLATGMTLSLVLAPPYPFKGAIGKILLPFYTFLFAWLFLLYPSAKEKLTKACFFLSFVLGMISIFQGLGIFHVFFPSLSRFIYKVPHEADLYLAVGFTRHHTTFGFTLLMLFHVLLAHELFSNGRKRKFLGLVSLAFCIAGILFTFSRGVWLALIFSTLSILFLSNWRLFLKVAVFFTVLFSGLYFTVPGFQQRLFALNLSANQERLGLWNIAWKMFQDSPLFGQGYDSFGYNVPRFSNLQILSPNTPLDVHNMYFEFLATSGLVGFLCFMFFLGSTFKFVNKSSKPWSMAALGVLISFCVGGFFDRYFDMPHTLVPILLLLGLCANHDPKSPMAGI